MGHTNTCQQRDTFLLTRCYLVCAHAGNPSRWLELGAASPHLMPHQLMDELAAIGTKTGNPELCFTPFANLLRTAVEAVVLAPSISMVSDTSIAALETNVGMHVWRPSCPAATLHCCTAARLVCQRRQPLGAFAHLYLAAACCESVVISYLPEV